MAVGEWELLQTLVDNVAIYVLGDYMLLGLAITFIFIILLTGFGINPLKSIVLGLPLLAGFMMAGWFGDYGYIVHLALIIIAFPYTWAIIKLTG